MKSTINLTNVYGTKSITLDQYPPEAWDFLEGDADGIDPASIKMLSESVPWLFRGVSILVQAVSSVPVCLVNGKNDVGYLGGELQSPFPFVDDLHTLERKIAASIILEGYGYLFRDNAKNMRATKKLWYWNPLTVTFDAKKTADTKIISFKRKNGSRTELYTSEQVLYFWPSDVYVEIGPPQSSPAKAALNAAGVLYNVDQYVAQYFKRGAVKAMMLAVKGSPNKDQKEELQKWWKDLTGGIKRAFNVFTMNADAVTPTVIGDGLEGLQDSALTQEKREDISTALGIPQSILFSTGAGGLGGGGVMSEDTYRFYQLTVVPLVKFICDVLNQQQFSDLGYRLDVREHEMPVFQEDEGTRATALKSLVDALANPEVFMLAAEIQGYDLSEEAEKKLLELIAKKEDNYARLQEQLNSKPQTTGNQTTDNQTQQDIPSKDLARLRRKALKNIGKEFEFESDEIQNLPALMRRLKNCKDEEEIKMVFEKPDNSDSNLSVLLDTAIKAVQTEATKQADMQQVVSAINAIAERIGGMPPVVVNVPKSAVTVNVPEQKAPIIKVEPVVDIKPEIVVKVPKPPRAKKARQKVTRDAQGNIIGTDTEYTYEA